MGEKSNVTIDNLYALSQLFYMPIDAIVRGNRRAIIPEPIAMDARERKNMSRSHVIVVI